MWLCLASFASSSLLYSFNSFYYFKTQPGQTEQRTAESNVQSLDSLVALPVVRRHQDQTSKKLTIHLKCIRHRILLRCHCMIPSRHGKLRMLISEGKGCKSTEKHFLHLNRVSCGLSNDHWRLLLHVRRIVKFGFAALTANAACQGGSHDAQHTGHPPRCNSISKDEANNVATIQHDLVKNESNGVSVWPMSLLLKQPIVRKQYSLGLRCYHLYDSDMLRLHSQPFIYIYNIYIYTYSSGII